MQGKSAGLDRLWDEVLETRADQGSGDRWWLAKNRSSLNHHSDHRSQIQDPQLFGLLTLSPEVCTDCHNCAWYKRYGLCIYCLSSSLILVKVEWNPSPLYPTCLYFALSFFFSFYSFLFSYNLGKMLVQFFITVYDPITSSLCIGRGFNKMEQVPFFLSPCIHPPIQWMICN